VRYHHRVVGAAWSTSEARWRLEIERADTGERTALTCAWLFCAGGYYRYDEGFTPSFPGRDRFRGTVIHPQAWPADLDHAGKRVVVIGSGATAVTILPAIAATAEHVTMVQRTPSYILPAPSRDVLAARLRRLLGDERSFRAVRRLNIARQRAVWRFCQRHPRAARRLIRWVNARSLPAGYPVDEHFSPPYDPWNQRLCLVPDGDLFRAIRAGRASVTTGRIATFTDSGVQLESGEELPADIIVTATGLNVQAFGGVALSVDGEPVSLPGTVAYKGVMLSGVPNLAYAIGYTNSSWTLKIGLLCEYFCRLLSYLDEHGYDVCRPAPADPGMPTRPFLDFDAGYIQRVIADLPRQGDRAPWLTSMDYHSDVRLLRRGAIADPELHMTSSRERSGAERA
jgi:monooxygenase